MRTADRGAMGKRGTAFFCGVLAGTAGQDRGAFLGDQDLDWEFRSPVFEKRWKEISECRTKASGEKVVDQRIDSRAEIEETT